MSSARPADQRATLSGQRIMLGVGAVSHGFSGIRRMMDGDLLGGLLDIATGAVNLKLMREACFTGDTKLYARGSWGEGWRRIDQITEADEVLSRDEHDPNGPLQWKRVEELFVRTARLAHLHAGGQVIRTTLEHPFYVRGKGWVPCRELEPGDLLSSHDGKWVAVEEVYDSGEYDTVYNLRVADCHTYFVGDDDWGFSVWAHNQYNGKLQQAGEEYVRKWLEQKGVKVVGEFVNHSGQGIDLVIRKPSGKLMFLEIKTTKRLFQKG